MKNRKGWTIWTRKQYTGDLLDPIETYSNRGHAVAALRGLERRSWQAGSEIQYALRKA